MSESIKSKLNLKVNFNNDIEYRECVQDLIQDEGVCSMDGFIQHGSITCFEHSLYVSYISYVVCKKLGLDYRSAARGGLLHDLFLYDWHVTKPKRGLHGFAHPYIALENAERRFRLNPLERDIIVKHMWPLTIKLPRCREAFIVSFVDKYCAFFETISYESKKRIEEIKKSIFTDSVIVNR